MADWKINPIMEWSLDGGTTWERVTDHGRTSLNVTVERFENKQRMADGTLRKYVVAKKHTFSTSWENLPDKAGPWLANGREGNWMESVHDSEDGMFHMRLRSGTDQDITYTGLNGKVLKVMFNDFGKNIVKRGRSYDLWSLDVTLEEV